MRFAPMVAVLLLAGCAAPRPPRIETQIVKVPVAAPCIPAELSGPPDYADSDSALAKAADAAERYLLLWLGRDQRKAREQELEAAVAACPKIAK